MPHVSVSVLYYWPSTKWTAISSLMLCSLQNSLIKWNKSISSLMLCSLQNSLIKWNKSLAVVLSLLILFYPVNYT